MSQNQREIRCIADEDWHLNCARNSRHWVFVHRIIGGFAMKALVLAMVLGINLLAPTLSHADPNNQNGCAASGDKPKKCDPTPVPEPGIAILVASGVLALSVFAMARKQRSN